MSLKYQQEIQQTIDTRICEECGRRFITGYGFSIAAAWLVTGHSKVPTFMCSQSAGNQHFGCSPEHAMMALIACLQHDEHLSENALMQKHQDMTDLGKSRIAEEDKWMLEKYPNFPFVD